MDVYGRSRSEKRKSTSGGGGDFEANISPWKIQKNGADLEVVNDTTLNTTFSDADNSVTHEAGLVAGGAANSTVNLAAGANSSVSIGSGLSTVTTIGPSDNNSVTVVRGGIEVGSGPDTNPISIGEGTSGRQIRIGTNAGHGINIGKPGSGLVVLDGNNLQMGVNSSNITIGRSSGGNLSLQGNIAIANDAGSTAPEVNISSAGTIQTINLNQTGGTTESKGTFNHVGVMDVSDNTAVAKDTTKVLTVGNADGLATHTINGGLTLANTADTNPVNVGSVGGNRTITIGKSGSTVNLIGDINTTGTITQTGNLDVVGTLTSTGNTDLATDTTQAVTLGNADGLATHTINGAVTIANTADTNPVLVGTAGGNRSILLGKSGSSVSVSGNFSQNTGSVNIATVAGTDSIDIATAGTRTVSIGSATSIINTGVPGTAVNTKGTFTLNTTAGDGTSTLGNSSDAFSIEGSTVSINNTAANDINIGFTGVSSSTTTIDGNANIGNPTDQVDIDGLVNIGLGAGTDNVNIASSGGVKTVTMGQTGSIVTIDSTNLFTTGNQTHTGDLSVTGDVSLATATTKSTTLGHPDGLTSHTINGGVTIAGTADTNAVNLGATGGNRTITIGKTGSTVNINATTATVDGRLDQQNGQVNLGNDATANSISIGSLGAKPIIMGNSSSITTVTGADTVVYGDTSTQLGVFGGNISLGSVANQTRVRGAFNVNTTNNDGTIVLGNQTDNSTLKGAQVSINTAVGDGSTVIGRVDNTTTINGGVSIGTGSGTLDMHIGDSGGNKTITVGRLNSIANLRGTTINIGEIGSTTNFLGTVTGLPGGTGEGFATKQNGQTDQTSSSAKFVVTYTQSTEIRDPNAQVSLNSNGCVMAAPTASSQPLFMAKGGVYVEPDNSTIGNEYQLYIEYNGVKDYEVARHKVVAADGVNADPFYLTVSSLREYTTSGLVAVNIERVVTVSATNITVKGNHKWLTVHSLNN